MRYQEDQGPPMFTYAALAVFVAFFGAEFKHADLTRFFAYPWRVADGEVWRLVTATFLHGSILHIAFNATLFYRFSTVIDNWLGPWAGLFLYAFVGTSSTAAQLLVGNSYFGMVGASGVVYGLFGFLWVMSRRRDDAAEAASKYIVETMLAWLGVCVVVNLFGGSIGNTAHAWGLLLGWLIGQTVVARRKWRIPIALATILVWALPIACSQRAVWDRTLAYVPILNRYYPKDVPAELRRSVESPDNSINVGFL
jgi:membrane associated rhomboid family serine protease